MTSPSDLSCSSPETEHEKKSIRHMFTMEEDDRLCELVSQYGDKNWRVISRQMPNRTTRQCRERYRNYLSPNVKNGPWTQEEDNLLQQKYLEYGPKWATIAKFFPSRSDVNIKNRWASNRHKSVRTTPKTILDSLRITQRELWNQISKLQMKYRLLQVPKQEPEAASPLVMKTDMFDIEKLEISELDWIMEPRLSDPTDWDLGEVAFM